MVKYGYMKNGNGPVAITAGVNLLRRRNKKLLASSSELQAHLTRL